jgi:hypothetical protein
MSLSLWKINKNNDHQTHQIKLTCDCGSQSLAKVCITWSVLLRTLWALTLTFDDRDQHFFLFLNQFLCPICVSKIKPNNLKKIN